MNQESPLTFSQEKEENNNLDHSKTSLVLSPKRTLPYYTRNGLKHTLRVLEIQDFNALAKTKLQILCANISNILQLDYNTESLVLFKAGNHHITFEELVNFIEDELLVNALDLNVNFDDFDPFCWTVTNQDKKKYVSKILEDEEVFHLWRAFNKIDINESGFIDIEETVFLLQVFMQGIGTPWTKAPLDNYTNKTELNFWELVECLESNYIIQNNFSSIYKDGLESILKYYIMEIIKSGFLVKKGHRIKSMKERWFVLTPDNLFYYDGKTKGAKKKGSICINKAVIIEPLFDMKSNRFRFLLNCGIKGVNYEIEALDLKSMNEWISAIQLCIDHSKDKTPLMRNLLERAQERKERRRKKAEEDQLRIENEALIQRQIQELQILKEAALAQSAVEAALLEEEKKRVEELELMKLEYEKLLEEERLARLSESEARANQQSILEEEMFKRQTLEKIKTEQENILNEERKIRESLEEMSKEQAIILEEERQRLKVLDAARQAAEDELKSAHLKLKEAEEERQLASLKVELAKEKTRKINLPVGLAKPLVVEQRGIVSHRGLGAFVEHDFSKKPLYLSSEQSPAAVNKINIDEGQRTEIVESNLLKPSESKEIFK